MFLILGSAEDSHAAHVAHALSTRGRRVEFLDSRRFPREISLAFTPPNDWLLSLPGGVQLAGGDVEAVYWRNHHGTATPDLPHPQQAWIAANDSRALWETFLGEFPTRWVNGRAGFELHQHKPAALARVARLGHPIPPTWIGNDAERLGAFAAAHAPCIFKPVQGGAPTEPLTAEHLTPENLRSLQCAPITAQREAAGTNIRVFVAGERVLACEVRTEALDFRDDPAAEIVVHPLPEEIAARSREIAAALELVWTGIDYRLSPAGEYVFLEANPSPMFLGFESRCGLPLTAALLELLTGEG